MTRLVAAVAGTIKATGPPPSVKEAGLTRTAAAVGAAVLDVPPARPPNAGHRAPTGVGRTLGHRRALARSYITNTGVTPMILASTDSLRRLREAGRVGPRLRSTPVGNTGRRSSSSWTIKSGRRNSGIGRSKSALNDSRSGRRRSDQKLRVDTGSPAT